MSAPLRYSIGDVTDVHTVVTVAVVGVAVAVRRLSECVSGDGGVRRGDRSRVGGDRAGG